MLTQPISNASFILEVKASSDDVIDNLKTATGSTGFERGENNWHQLFFGIVETNIRAKQLAVISQGWRTPSTSIFRFDTDWHVTISFSLANPIQISRDNVRQITSSLGGSGTANVTSALRPI